MFDRPKPTVGCSANGRRWKKRSGYVTKCYDAYISASLDATDGVTVEENPFSLLVYSEQLLVPEASPAFAFCLLCIMGQTMRLPVHSYATQCTSDVTVSKKCQDEKLEHMCLDRQHCRYKYVEMNVAVGCASWRRGTRRLQLTEFPLVTRFFVVINKLPFRMSCTSERGCVNVTMLWDHRPGSFRRQFSLM